MSANPTTLRADATPARDALASRFAEVRAESIARASFLTDEDQCVQSMPDASPTKWHLAHTTWFFEAVVLVPHDKSYEPFDSRFFHLFNSYYEQLGPRHPRPQRGLLTRPSVDEVHRYRKHVDQAVKEFIAKAGADVWREVAPLIELGLNHEQQHQELIVTDLLHAFSCNPLLPAYQDVDILRLLRHEAPVMRWLEGPSGLVEVGHSGEGFAFDNETPRHRVNLAPYRIANRLVSCGEYLDFMEDGGYERATLWLSDGWATVQQQGWKAPMHWIAPEDPRAPSDDWQLFGVFGVQPLQRGAPAMHLSFYEASAYAQWAGARLPTEFEWEAAHALPGITQVTGEAWQWTRSSYDPYPGFRPFSGAVGEYNGKFMVGQLVLRGGSHATPEGHTRPTYRNFFPPAARWQFTGLRLAQDA